MSLTVNLYYNGKNGDARKFAQEMEDKSIADLLPDFIHTVLDVASGKKVKAERNGIHGFAIFKNGVTL